MQRLFCEKPKSIVAGHLPWPKKGPKRCSTVRQALRRASPLSPPDGGSLAQPAPGGQIGSSFGRLGGFQSGDWPNMTDYLLTKKLYPVQTELVPLMFLIFNAWARAL